jgi:hypothetical protein
VPDLALAVTVSRTLLGLAPLDINDHLNYYVTPQLLGGQVAWTRTQITSPWLDGAVTTNRVRQMVTEPLVIEVLGGTHGELKANVDTLVQAFIQDSFDLELTMGDAAYAYRCEAADYTLGWNGPRMMANQVQVTFSVPRQPTALLGVV